MNILFISMENLSTNSSATIQNKGIIVSLSNAGNTIDTLTLELDKKSLSFDNSMNDIKEFINQSFFIPLDMKYRSVMSKKIANNKKVTAYFLIVKIIKNIYKLLQIFDAQKLNLKNLKYSSIDYSKYDLIFSCSDPKSSHLIGRIINSKHQLPWVQYWGDPMFNDITRNKGIFDFFVKKSESQLLKKADLIFYASPLTLELQKKTFINFENKMKFLNQVALNYKVENNSKKVINSEKLNIVYSGSYNSKIRNIVPLYNSFINLPHNLFIVGSSNLRLSERNNIKILGSVDFNNAQKLERDADLLVTLCNNRGTQIPGKIYYNAYYKKPIIVILDGEYKSKIKRFLKDFNRYIFCFNNEKSIKKAIESAKKAILQKEIYEKSSYRLSTAYMGSEFSKEIKKVI